jgi:uncharacterized protein YjbI with pentapeptide repeats
MRRVSAQQTHFNSSWLKGADLRWARLHFSVFDNATLTNANMQHVVAYGANFQDAWLVGANLSHARFVIVREPEFRLADLESADITVLRPVFRQPSSFRRARLRDAKLFRTQLGGVNLSDAQLDRARMRETNLDSADLTGARLDRADLRDSVLNGAILCGASLIRTRLEGALYDSQTRWPKGFDPVARGATLEGPADGISDDEAKPSC